MNPLLCTRATHLKLGCFASCAMIFSSSVMAVPPTDERAEALLAVLQTEKQMEAKLDALDAMNRRGFSEKLAGGRQLTSEQQAAVERAVLRVSNIVRADMAWTQVKPGLVRIVQETFESDELDGILAFYATPAGRAMLAKFPQVEQRSARHMINLSSTAMKKIEGVAESELDPVKSVK